LAFSTALYKLDRRNTSAPDPADPSRIVQTGSQRSEGVEANFAGNLSSRWQVFAGYAVQHAEILSQTTSSRAGATIPMVPSRSASFWSRYDFSPELGAGVGLVAQSKMFAAIDNSVTLPGFARTDAAIYLGVSRNLKVQVNVENLLNVKYFANSQGNNNIMPGAPRTFRLSLSAF
jgi:catecholate siderophore receptor